LWLHVQIASAKFGVSFARTRGARAGLKYRLGQAVSTPFSVSPGEACLLEEDGRSP
jgi:hypothetical protein